jgi:hypothetical protein
MKERGALLFLVLSFFCSWGSSGQERTLAGKYDVIRPRVSTLWNEKQYAQAVSILEAFYQAEGFSFLDENVRQDILYDLACGEARLGDKKKALRYLRETVDAGFSNYWDMIKDPDLESLRNEKAFKDLAERVHVTPNRYLILLRRFAAYDGRPGNKLPEFVYQAADNDGLSKLRSTYKLDEVAGTGDEVTRILNLMRWVHRAVKHDGSSENPVPCDSLNLLKVCREQRRGVNCRMMAIIMNEACLAEGFASRFVTCLPFDPKDTECHVINAVYAPSLRKWIYVDPTFEAYFRDEKGAYLSVQEVRERMIQGLPLALDEQANWNGQPENSEEYLRYMAKNLFRLQCPLVSAFGYESSPGKHYYVELEPVGYSSAQVDKNVERIANPADFWAAPTIRP